MKKTLILSVAAALMLLTLLAGCSVKSPVNQTVKNANGSIAVNLPDSLRSAPTPVPPDDFILPVTDASTSTVVFEQTEPQETAKAVSDIIEIKEKLFVAQTNDIYYNAADYIGKTIRYEGLFDSYYWEETDTTYYSVFRYGPGCCGTDSNCGFEVIWHDGQTDYPKLNDWVEAVGVLEEYDENGYKYLRLALSSLTVLEVRGNEYVEQ